MYIMFCRDKSLSPTRKWIGKIDQSPPSSQSRFPQLNNYIQYRSEDCAALHRCQAQIRSNVFIEIKSGTVKDSGRSFLMEIPCGTKAINCFRIELRNGRDFLPSSNRCRCHSGTCAFLHGWGDLGLPVCPSVRFRADFVDSWDVSDDLGVAPALGVFQRCPAFIVDHPEGGTPLHQ